MGRLGLVPEIKFGEDFKQLRRDIEAIKAAQRVGRDILRPKRIEQLDGSGIPTTYDLIATYDPVRDEVKTEFALRFNAEHQDEPWGAPLFKLMYGDTNTPASPHQTFGFAYPFLADFQSVPKRMSFHGWFGNNVFGDHTSIYLKVYFYATDSGILTVSPEVYV